MLKGFFPPSNENKMSLGLTKTWRSGKDLLFKEAQFAAETGPQNLLLASLLVVISVDKVSVPFL